MLGMSTQPTLCFARCSRADFDTVDPRTPTAVFHLQQAFVPPHGEVKPFDFGCQARLATTVRWLGHGDPKSSCSPVLSTPELYVRPMGLLITSNDSPTSHQWAGWRIHASPLARKAGPVRWGPPLCGGRSLPAAWWFERPALVPIPRSQAQGVCPPPLTV